MVNVVTVGLAIAKSVFQVTVLSFWSPNYSW